MTQNVPSLGGNGVALNTVPVTLGQNNNVTEGDPFGIFWSNNEGNYGFVTATGAVLPAEGAYGTIDPNFCIGESTLIETDRGEVKVVIPKV